MLGRTNTGGGGGGLNFSVVGGTSQPENPKENTIWVNTDTAITAWAFSPSEPESPAEGMVWINTGTGGTVTFNALKKNTVMVYPISAKQYVSGSWVSKNAKSCQGGLWVEWVVFLYNEGDERTDLTGGWSATATKPSTSGSDPIVPSVTKGSESITISVTSGYPNYRIGYLTSAYKIDLTNYNKLIVNVTALSIHCYVYVSNSKTSGYTPSASMELSVGSNVLDISSLSGSFYILIGMGGHEGTASCTFDKVYLS